MLSLHGPAAQDSQELMWWLGLGKKAGSTGWDTAEAELVQLDGTQLSREGQAKLTPKACSWESKIC